MASGSNNGHLPGRGRQVNTPSQTRHGSKTSSLACFGDQPGSFKLCESLSGIRFGTLSTLGGTGHTR
eukprot:365988-Chlamydomonas_euryale.AAC.11